MHPSLRCGFRYGSALVCSLTLVTLAGCLDRPVVSSQPETTARFVAQISHDAVDKIDLLFMVDNSQSMADKQDVLAKAVPDLVDRLVNPTCVTPDGVPTASNQPANASDPCPSGSEREFAPINDIHIGVITSSLGSHGAGACEGSGGQGDDQAHLIVRSATGGTVKTYDDRGFLAWDPTGKKDTPPGESSADNLVSAFTELVQGAGQNGCGFESQLESVYRFLIDPEPPLSVSVATPGDPAILAGRDDDLLAARARFLRPDSLVAVIALTDENDCSVIEGGNAYLSLYSSSDNPHPIPRGTSACRRNPNDPCCFNCTGVAPAGANCPDPAADAECQKGGYTDDEDPVNLRCFDQKRKYGIDFLYPVARYIDGFTKTEVVTRAGATVPNPLFSDPGCGNGNCRPPRDRANVFFAGIVGVPWQDIAKNPNDLAEGYWPAKEIADRKLWEVILGDPSASPPELPADALMRESVDPRTGAPANPITHDAVADVNAGPGTNRINGHEWDTTETNTLGSRADLQYACTFTLPKPRDCATLNPNADSCDCFDDNSDAIRNPLCQDPMTGGYGHVQYGAKGYPGTRHLQVLKGLGAQGIVASICPANLEEGASNTSRAADYGYRPAVSAIITQLALRFPTPCLPRELDVNACAADPEFDKVPCVVVEAYDDRETGGVCDCTADGRTPADPRVVTSAIAAAGNCVCQMRELVGAEAGPCVNEANASDTASGWCYVDPTQGVGTVEAAGKACDRNIHFVGTSGKPRNHATVFIACQEKAYDPSASSDKDAAASACALH